MIGKPILFFNHTLDIISNLCFKNRWSVFRTWQHDSLLTTSLHNLLPFEDAMLNHKNRKRWILQYWRCATSSNFNYMISNREDLNTFGYPKTAIQFLTVFMKWSYALSQWHGIQIYVDASKDAYKIVVVRKMGGVVWIVGTSTIVTDVHRIHLQRSVQSTTPTILMRIEDGMPSIVIYPITGVVIVQQQPYQLIYTKRSSHEASCVNNIAADPRFCFTPNYCL